jgi:dTDP-glucose 4,6-dehydratase
MENIELVRMICDILDTHLSPMPQQRRRDLITFVDDRPGHDRRYAIASTKLKDELGWEPKESFESGLRRTISWYLENQSWVTRVKSGAYQDWVKQHYG